MNIDVTECTSVVIFTIRKQAGAISGIWKAQSCLLLLWQEDAAIFINRI